MKYYATASGYICHLDLGYRPKPCLITGLIELLPWLTFYCLGRHSPWHQLVFTHAKYLPRLLNSNTLVKRSSVDTLLSLVWVGGWQLDKQMYQAFLTLTTTKQKKA